MIVKNFYQKNFIKRIDKVFLYNFKEYVSIFRRMGILYYQGTLDSKVLVLITSKNQKKYLASVNNYCGSDLLVVAFDARLFSGEIKKTRIKNLPVLATSLSLYGVYFRFWSNFMNSLSGLKTVVLLNDHLPPFIAYYSAAKTIGLRTIYHQHAYISSVFPRLFVDEALLFGSWSYNLYRQSQKSIGVSHENCKVSFTSPVFGTVRKSYVKAGIGVATNRGTDTLKLSKLLKFLDVEEIFLAPHPGESQNRVNKYLECLKVCNVRIVDSKFLLENCEKVFLGNTGLLFDCILNDVNYEYVDIDDSIDYYSVGEFNKFCETEGITPRNALGYE